MSNPFVKKDLVLNSRIVNTEDVIPRVVIANIPIGQKGAIVYDLTSNNIEVSNGLDWIQPGTNPTMPVHIHNTTPSTSPTTGALVVEGGVGVGGDINVAGNTIIEGTTTIAGNTLITSTTVSTSPSTGAFVDNGGAGIGGDLNVGGNTILEGDTLITSTTVSTSPSTGAFVDNGGAGIGGNLNVGGNVTIGGNVIGPTLQLAVVSYFYPGAAWAPIIAAGEPGIAATIINPNSGVGLTFDPNYLAQTQAVQAIGGTVWGYVYSSYGARSVAVIQAEILLYFQWYGVNGIFMDEASTSCLFTSYYAGLRTFAQGAAALYGRTSLFVINPGTQTQECYATSGAADVITNVEMAAIDYLSPSFTQPAWVSNYPPSLFYHIIYAASEPDLSTILLLARSRNAGLVYVTDGTLPNPYSALPSYWVEEVADIRAQIPPTAGNTLITSTTVSTSPTTGAFVDNGGAGIGGNLNVGGNTTIAGSTLITSTAISTSPTSGAFVNNGGAGIGGNLNVGGNTTIGGNTLITSTTASTSPSTGAFVDNGGAGIGGNLNVGGTAVFNGTTLLSGQELITNNTSSTTPSTGALVVTGGVGIGQNLNVGGDTILPNLTTNGTTTATGVVNISNTTVSTSPITGALVVTGGEGVSGNVNVGGDLVVTGSISGNVIARSLYDQGKTQVITVNTDVVPPPLNSTLTYVSTNTASWQYPSQLATSILNTPVSVNTSTPTSAGQILTSTTGTAPFAATWQTPTPPSTVATALASPSGPITVNSSTASVGQVLTATDSSHATWQTLGGGGIATALATTTTPVSVNTFPPPTQAGEVLVSTSTSDSGWGRIGYTGLPQANLDNVLSGQGFGLNPVFEPILGGGPAPDAGTLYVLAGQGVGSNPAFIALTPTGTIVATAMTPNPPSILRYWGSGPGSAAQGWQPAVRQDPVHFPNAFGADTTLAISPNPPAINRYWGSGPAFVQQNWQAQAVTQSLVTPGYAARADSLAAGPTGDVYSSTGFLIGQWFIPAFQLIGMLNDFTLTTNGGDSLLTQVFPPLSTSDVIRVTVQMTGLSGGVMGYGLFDLGDVQFGDSFGLHSPGYVNLQYRISFTDAQDFNVESNGSIGNIVISDSQNTLSTALGNWTVGGIALQFKATGGSTQSVRAIIKVYIETHVPIFP